LEKDAHGNTNISGNGALGKLLADKLKSKLQIRRVRADTFGYIQRCFLGCLSDTDCKEAREVGEKAVQFSVLQEKDGSVSIRRIGNYAVQYDLVPFAAVAGLTKKMPDEFINDSGNNVTTAFHDYLRPLLGNGILKVARFRAPRVEKILYKE